MAAKKVKVLVIVGSPSDVETMTACTTVLDEFGVSHELTVASAHRSPKRARELAEGAAGRGVRVIICAAGMAAHLAGAVAGHTHLPVIGVPLKAGDLNGLDALLATVQMPPGVPVATVAVGNAGAENAAHLAVRILALSDPGLSKKVKSYRKKMANKVEAAAKALEKES